MSAHNVHHCFGFSPWLDIENTKPTTVDDTLKTEDNNASSNSLNLSLEDEGVKIHVNIGKIGKTVQIGSNNHMHVNGRKSAPSPGGRKVAQIKVPKRTISDDDIEKIAVHLGMDWRHLGLKLGFVRGELDALEYDNHMAGLHEIIYQMMLAWKEKQGVEAWVRCVASKLVEIKRADVAKLFSV